MFIKYITLINMVRFPEDPNNIKQLKLAGYFENSFFIDIYKTFEKFGWRLKDKDLVKFDKYLFPSNDIPNIIKFLYLSGQLYFLNLFYLAICQDIFNYAKKQVIDWQDFKNYLDYSNIKPEDIQFLKYRWDITTTYTRKYIMNNLPEFYKKKYIPFVLNNKTIVDIQKIDSSNIFKPKNPIIFSELKINIETTNEPYKFNKNSSWWVLTNNILIKVLFKIFPELSIFIQDKSFIITNIINVSNNSLINFVIISKFTEDEIYKGFKIAKILGCKTINTYGNIPNQVIIGNFLNINLNFHNTDKSKLQNIITQLQLKSIVPFIGLRNAASSCYMDSVLFSIFYIKSNTIEYNLFKKPIKNSSCTNIEEIRSELLNIKNTILNKGNRYTCTILRNIFKYCPPGKQYSTFEEQDAGEFLIFLFNVFQMNLSIISYKIYGTNDITSFNPTKNLTSENIDKKSGIINFVNSFILSSKKEHQINEFLVKVEDSILEQGYVSDKDIRYYRRISIETILSTESDIYVFFIGRADPITDSVLNNIVKPNQHIIIGDKQFELYSVILHIGSIEYGHYYSYFLYNKEWYKYDDSKVGFTKIGFYNDLITKTMVNTNGVLYFYKLT